MIILSFAGTANALISLLIVDVLSLVGTDRHLVVGIIVEYLFSGGTISTLHIFTSNAITTPDYDYTHLNLNLPLSFSVLLAYIVKPTPSEGTPHEIPIRAAA